MVENFLTEFKNYQITGILELKRLLTLFQWIQFDLQYKTEVDVANLDLVKTHLLHVIIKIISNLHIKILRRMQIKSYC